MRLLSLGAPDNLRRAVDEGVRCDYVYSYPPRQAYRPFPDGVDADDLACRSLKAEASYNLYIHFPFCRQICSYCNLYAVASRGGNGHAEYAGWVLTEIERRAAVLNGKSVRTVYFGGGTPSMIDPAVLRDVLTGCSEILGFDLGGVSEVAIEVAPDTATEANLGALRAAGFNRINLGVQSAEPAEIVGIGRRYEEATIDSSLACSLAAGFANVCVDLIYGLEAQTTESWRASVEFVARTRPQTICAYPLTLRPGTGFARRGYIAVASGQYEKYDVANEILRSAGYEQQTHVRWALPGVGGYLQKEYHWACEAVVGFGAGARSYLWDLDIRNGYSLRPRRGALERYGQAIVAGRSPITDGLLMDDDERRRKAVILGLNRLDRRVFASRYRVDPVDAFADEFESLAACGLIEMSSEVVSLTTLAYATAMSPCSRSCPSRCAPSPPTLPISSSHD